MGKEVESQGFTKFSHADPNHSETQIRYKDRAGRGENAMVAVEMILGEIL